MRERRLVSLEACTHIDRELLPLYERLEAPLDDELLRREQTCQLVAMTLSQLPPRYREGWRPSMSAASASAIWRSCGAALKKLWNRNYPAPQGISRMFLTLARDLSAESY